MKITEAEYFEEVKSIAENLVKEAMEQENALGVINNYLLHEAIDRHRWIVDYAYNLGVYQHSNNQDYFVDSWGKEDLACTLKEHRTSYFNQVVAYWCLYADVMDKIHSILGVNVKFTGKEQDPKNEATIYWFEIKGKTYGLEHTGVYGVAHSDSEEYAVDCDNDRIENEVLHRKVLEVCKVTEAMIYN